ncbi:MAG: type II toxin-antitoxin system RelE/ParE family toxin [Bacteroidetes bacterium]|nr:type II toxin-antitoxin system RelE/ParE family toxin [Bacteroidota bacterium]MBU1717651.1 type II toxin-antitoxin system RelE/ParE family toxin [Bacteroidota bacterium]
MIYKVKIEPEALADIQDITDWYNNAKPGLGKRFQKTIVNQVDGLINKPHGCAVRYKQIRCVLVKKFPYMIHFYINEETKTIEVLAVISTDRNPKIWLEKSSMRVK